MARRGETALWVRLLVFAVVLGLSVGVAAVAAHQEDVDSGSGLGILGTVLIAGTLWFVAARRRAWALDSANHHLLGTLLAGVIAVAGAGMHTISDVVLSTRGELVAVSAALYQESDEDDSRLHLLLPMDGGPAIRGFLSTEKDFDDTRIAKVLVDPAEFVRPAFPDDLETVTWVLISLFGVLCLAVTIIGTGFPITPRYSGVEDEDSEADTAR